MIFHKHTLPQGIQDYAKNFAKNPRKEAEK